MKKERKLFGDLLSLNGPIEKVGKGKKTKVLEKEYTEAEVDFENLTSRQRSESKLDYQLSQIIRLLQMNYLK